MKNKRGSRQMAANTEVLSVRCSCHSILYLTLQKEYLYLTILENGKNSSYLLTSCGRNLWISEPSPDILQKLKHGSDLSIMSYIFCNFLDNLLNFAPHDQYLFLIDHHCKLKSGSLHIQLELDILLPVCTRSLEEEFDLKTYFYLDFYSL